MADHAKVVDVCEEDRKRLQSFAAPPSFPSVTDGIRTFIDAWNDRCVPFTWTKTAEDILTTADWGAVSGTDH